VTVNGTSSQDVLPRGHEIFSAATLGATQLNRRQSIAIYSAILYNNSDGAWVWFRPTLRLLLIVLYHAAYGGARFRQERLSHFPTTRRTRRAS
jgi:hypothetical protein